MNINEVKSKIAKLLRLQTSTNVGEATNAAAFVENYVLNIIFLLQIVRNMTLIKMK